ncbi:MAG: cell division protein ZapC domain-containing protein [Pseudoalteromonas sp.]|uniref:cell division protein ZapC domain-containing protein n=1 Tax=unclassified Pseudoalteromonas TaxID=194690 RepID=UPI003F98BF22
MFQASRQWKWVACTKRNRLLVDLDQDMQLCTPYKLRQLTDSIKQQSHFSLDDAAFYQQVYQYLDSFKIYSSAELCQISLNATAAKLYLKPVLAKSWFFKEYTGSEPSVEAIVKLSSVVQTGEFLIVEHTQDASLCINLSEHFKLDENLHLNQFEVIRVLNNRVHPILNKISHTQTA